ncbi:MAG TPA: PEP-CTERM sorting domain-containing protein [Tepidisphaeraceae bacterium]|jgi:hypothetical protein|nr:PEP-CTERM sorting domain-containing protein [Tepidisphaeraceae bacterium]
MRRILGFSAALMGGSFGLLLSVAPLSAQTALTASNGNFDLPSDGASGTDTTAEISGGNTNTGVGAYLTAGVGNGWYLSPAVGDNYTNNGMRDQFDEPTPDGNPSGWNFWLQTFVQDGYTAQTVQGVTAGTNYVFAGQMAFQDGSAAGQGYNAVTLANQATDSKSMDTGNLYSYLGIIFLNHSGVVVGTLDANGFNDETDIGAGSITVYNQSNGATAWIPESVSGIAPAGATQAELVVGWQNGGVDGNTGGQSAFFTTGAVPEPATLSVMGLGGMALLARRRSRRVA